MRTPDFWGPAQDGLASRLLSPLSALFALGARCRGFGTTAWRAPVPVICVGNLTVGGTGKTPTVLALTDRLRSMGLNVACVSRGYGGRLHEPVAVDATRHSAADVGDEPLLLARAAPTWIGRDRKDAARMAIAEGADVVLLDDGLQYPGLRKDLSLVVIDGGYGFGNGRVLPAGPLREPVARGLARASAVVLVGDDAHGVIPTLPRGLPVLRTKLVPDDSALRFKNRKVFAFAGIGRPAKFFATLRQIGAEIVGEASFADHHAYRPDEATRLVEEATRLGAQPVTTTKDFVRLPEATQHLVTSIGVHLRFDDDAALDRLLHQVFSRPDSSRAQPA